MTDRIPFKLPNGLAGTAMILLIDLPDGRKLVTCANENEEDDAPVNMAVENLFWTTCQQHQLDPARVVWVEYTSYPVPVAGGELGGWELVTFKGPGSGEGPEWRRMTPADWEA